MTRDSRLVRFIVALGIAWLAITIFGGLSFGFPNFSGDTLGEYLADTFVWALILGIPLFFGSTHFKPLHFQSWYHKTGVPGVLLGLALVPTVLAMGAKAGPIKHTGGFEGRCDHTGHGASVNPPTFLAAWMPRRRSS